MAVYQIRVNEKMSLGKSVIAYLQSVPQAVSFEIPKKKQKPKSELYYGLKSAFEDVRLMMDGKKRKKSLDEFLEEMRKERENELCNSND
jgi:hypothetical protein